MTVNCCNDIAMQLSMQRSCNCRRCKRPLSRRFTINHRKLQVHMPTFRRKWWLISRCRTCDCGTIVHLSWLRLPVGTRLCFPIAYTYSYTLSAYIKAYALQCLHLYACLYFCMYVYIIKWWRVLFAFREPP